METNIMDNYTKNRAKLNKAYIEERAKGYPWHQIAIYLKEIHKPENVVLQSDELTDELIRRLPELRTDEKFNYNGTGKVIPTIASQTKATFYNTDKWKYLKQYVWHNTPGAKICPYCGQPIISDDWTIHHNMFTESDIDQYENDHNVLHYTIMHTECHRACHDILRKSVNKDEIMKLGFMGRHWLKNALNRFLD